MMLIGCFRAVRWYARNDQYPADGMPHAVWERLASFDSPCIGCHPCGVLQWVAVIALRGLDLDDSFLAACKRGMPKHVALFIEHGADVNVKDNAGGTALVLANKEGHREVEELLKQHGAQ